MLVEQEYMASVLVERGRTLLLGKFVSDLLSDHVGNVALQPAELE